MESPVIVENCVNYKPHPKTDETGFPFEDTDYTSQSDRLQSTLNDIAQRHPEFADHLSFDNLGSWRRKRNPSGSSADRDDTRSHTSGHSSRSFDTPDSSRRFADHSFPSGFNHFPFTQHFDDFTDDIRTEEKPPEVPRSHVNERRGRKAHNPNLPQHLSNTVDLGQKQAPVEENRSQRSMSAPPENRTGHSNPSYDNSHGRNMGGIYSRGTSRQNVQPPQASGPEPSHTPKERIIPIFVEGRDELVTPKNVHTNTEAKVEPNHIHQPYHPPQMSGSWQQNIPSGQHGTTPYTKHSTPPAQQKPEPRQVPVTPPKEELKEQPQMAQEPPSVNLNDPLEKIKSIKADVLDLMHQIETFTGTRKDKHYVYLDEMLTRNLLKLDNIETEGKDNIRLARREAIKCIQETINNLEARAQGYEKQQLATAKSDSGTSIPESATAEPKTYLTKATLLMKTPSIGEEPQPPCEAMAVDPQPVDPVQSKPEPMEIDNTAGKAEGDANRPETSTDNLADERAIEVSKPVTETSHADPTPSEAQPASETSNPSQLADETK